MQNNQNIIYCYVFNNTETYYNPSCDNCNDAGDVNTCTCYKSLNNKNIIYFRGKLSSDNAFRMCQTEITEYLRKRK